MVIILSTDKQANFKNDALDANERRSSKI